MKLPQISGINVIKRLKKAGFVPTRQKGDHVRIENDYKTLGKKRDKDGFLLQLNS